MLLARCVLTLNSRTGYWACKHVRRYAEISGVTYSLPGGVVCDGGLKTFFTIPAGTKKIELALHSEPAVNRVCLENHWGGRLYCDGRSIPVTSALQRFFLYACLRLPPGSFHSVFAQVNYWE